jgi:hypothetical protein
MLDALQTWYTIKIRHVCNKRQEKQHFIFEFLKNRTPENICNEINYYSILFKKS